MSVRDVLSASLQEQAHTWFAPIAAPQGALEHSEFRDSHDLVAQVVVAKLPPSHVIIVFRRDAATLKVHVEPTTPKPNLPYLKEIAEETADDVANFLTAHGMKVTSLKIRIYVEGEHLTTGRRVPWAARLLGSARKEIAGRLAVPVATFLISLAVDSDVRRAAVNAAAAFVGVLCWLLLSTTLEKSGFTYE